MTVLFNYVYFSIFLAFFIGNIQNRAGFITLYTVHLITTFIAVNYMLFTMKSLFITQFPFILISIIVVILLPFSTYNQKKQDELEGQLEDANKRIADLVKLDERQRIARDLHDTLGQKLSLIGLKSDLAAKLVAREPERAKAEILDVQQTARTALKEVRELVTQMRGTRLEDEVFRIQQILHAADIKLEIDGDPLKVSTTLLTENVLSMCLKEAVTNIVKHSKAANCQISFQTTPMEFVMTIKDDGIGFAENKGSRLGNGLRGMRERLEFVNGNMEVASNDGITIKISVPNAVRQPMKELSE